MSRFSELEARAPGWDASVMIEAHINGVRSKLYNPNSPTEYEEITQEALRCWEAGATAIHAHNTNIGLHGREAADDYLRSWRPVLEKYPEVFWYCTGSALDPFDPAASGLEHAELLAREAGLEVCVVAPGSVHLVLGADEKGDLSGIPCFLQSQRRIGNDDVVKYAAGEELAILHDDAYLPAHRAHIELLKILPVIADHTAGGLFKPEQ